MTHSVLELVYLMLPAYCANMAAPFTKFWRGWNRPINERLLGSHKTVVGFALGGAIAIGVAFLQSRLDPAAIPLLWEPQSWLAVGIVSGLGALGGDALKSFFKRRVGIAPGGRWIPADQLDFVLGALAGLAFFVDLGLADALAILVFTFVVDVAVNQIAFRAHVRDSAW